jgi:hypothetical protein
MQNSQFKDNLVMHTLFICGSLEPGKDGVGDYTRRLSGALISQGYEISILSLCDNHVSNYVREIQEIEQARVPTYRIPEVTIYSQRLKWTQELILQQNPDWISLQFVPYSFNAKGLPFWLPLFLKKVKGKHNWHIMFHELWLGIDKESSIKHKIIGQIQQILIKRLIAATEPSIVTTQNKLYQFFLQSHGVKTAVFPICGNIPIANLKEKSSHFTQFVLFGTIHQGAPFKDFIKDLLSYRNTLVKPIKFIFIGKNGPEIDYYKHILENNNISFEVMGLQSENVISQVLSESTYGISTTPYFQTEKSGVYAAYKEHQLNTISISREWTPTAGQYDIPQIIKYDKNNLNLALIHIATFDMNQLTDQFINFINKV